MPPTYTLHAVGTAKKIDHHMKLIIDTSVIPAMKYLSQFSHATIFFGDNSDKPFKQCVVSLQHVDEKTGYIQLDTNCGLMDGNPIFDIKPYMPCEDRLLDSYVATELLPQIASDVGGETQVTITPAGIIRKEQGHFYLYPDNYESFQKIALSASHLKVLWWFSRFDKMEYRRVMQGIPPYESAPKSGVFATRSPVRPNLIASTIARVLDVEPNSKRIHVSTLDCFDQTPLLGIAPYLPAFDKIDNFTVPSWLAHWPESNTIAVNKPATTVEIDDNDLHQLAQYIPTNPTTDLDLKTYYHVHSNTEISRNEIVIRGARQNNLQNINLVLPKERIIAVAGVSGSGKSSLAFDTLYAESRLRLSEMHDGLDKPDVDSITGLPPAVAIAQKSIGRNPRSTVGTFTGIQDRLRLLFASIGIRHCPVCGKAVQPRKRDELLEILHSLSKHTLEISSHGEKNAIDFICLTSQSDYASLLDNALEQGKGAFLLRIDGSKEILMQTRQMCYHCRHILFEMSPTLFSFNNPESMCPVCNGLGNITDFDPKLIIPRPEQSLLDSASDYWKDMRKFEQNPTANWMRGELLALAKSRGIDLEIPWNQLPQDFRQAALYGTGEEEVSWTYQHPKNGRSGTITRPVQGAIPCLKRLLSEGAGKTSEAIVEQFMHQTPCHTCHGERLGPESRLVTIGGVRFPKATDMTVDTLADWINTLPYQLEFNEATIAKNILNEIHQKLQHLIEVGLPYLGLNRTLPTLSGGELQRLKLVSQMGLELSGLLYVMDEPTAGLHPRDQKQIIHAMQGLKAQGNTVLLVEHEEAILRSADYLIEMGPGAGVHGGHVIWQGAPKELADVDTQTGLYLSQKKCVKVPHHTLPSKDGWVEITGAKGHNLKNINICFPKECITCITGVSGSGKSTLASNVIYPAIQNYIAKKPTGTYCETITGIAGLDSVVYASQSPIGRSNRSGVATYTGLMDELRVIFSSTDAAKVAKLKASSFSFNTKDGQCDACKGDGEQSIAVPFSADIRVTCPLCAGKRYKSDVLAITYHGLNISEVLNLQVEEALEFFHSSKKITTILQILTEVGLGYLTLGQSTSTFSGGEAQRIKLAKALMDYRTGNMLYILDEPTSGLHFSDIQNLLELLSRMGQMGHTLLIIEHNQNMIRNADWIIDLGPEGGDAGGELIIQGTPGDVMAEKNSSTGQELLA